MAKRLTFRMIDTAREIAAERYWDRQDAAERRRGTGKGATGRKPATSTRKSGQRATR